MGGRRTELMAPGLMILAAAVAHPAHGANLSLTSVEAAGGPRTYLAIDGEIEVGDWRRFTRAMRDHPAISGILLSSEGGSLDDGLAIAKHIHNSSLDTLVVRQCHSVCAIMFLAGRHRHIATDAQLTFHSAYKQLGDWVVEDDQANVRVAWFLGQLGYPLKLAEIWSTTRSLEATPISVEINDKLRLGLSYVGPDTVRWSVLVAAEDLEVSR